MPYQSNAAAWAPTVMAPLTVAAHLANAFRPYDDLHRAMRVLDVAAVAAAAGIVVAQLLTRSAGRRDGLPNASLTLASTGVLGLLLDRQARHAEAERARLERRASIVERLVPKRRSRLDRVVVHV
jgi:hypothetical protein